jgi:hypothetical protein
MSAAEGLERLEVEVLSRLRAVHGLDAFRERVPDEVLVDVAVKLTDWARLHLVAGIHEISAVKR